MTASTTKYFRRICPVLIVADADAAAAYYRDKFGFSIMQSEGAEFAMVDRDNCRIFLKRGSADPSPPRNRHRCDDGGGDREFPDIITHFESMDAFDAFYKELLGTKPNELSEISQWGGMRAFSAHDLDGYNLEFLRSL